MSIIALLLLVLFIGFLSFMVGRAPWIDAEYKAVVKWFLLVIAGLILILAVASFFGVDLLSALNRPLSHEGR